jgi:hypothetical protein
MLGGAEKVSTVLTKLRITERQEVIMPVSNTYAIEKRPEDSGEELIISLFVGTRIDTTLQLSVCMISKDKVGIKPRPFRL